LNTSLFSWFYYGILENKLSTFFIPLLYALVKNSLQALRKSILLQKKKLKSK